MLAIELIKGADKKWIKKQIFKLLKEIVLYIIKTKLMEEFQKRDLHIKFAEEINEWCIYLDQQKFSKELQKKMIKEIDRFMAEKKTIEEIIDEAFDKPDWEIIFIEDMPKNYVFKAALGYS